MLGRPGTRSPRRRRSGRRTSSATPCWKAGAASTASCSASPAPWSGPPTNMPSRTTNACRNSPSSSLDSLEAAAVLRTSRSTTTSRSSSWPTRLTWLAEQLGYDDPAGAEGAGRQVAAASGAAELVNGTQAGQTSKLRKKLYEGGKKAVDASNDPMIELARLVDPESRAVRKIMENQVDEVRTAGLRPDRQGQVRHRRHQHLSRRHLHAAAGVRHGQGLRGGRQARSLRDDLRRPVRARPRSTTTSRRSTCRSAGSNARTS